MAGDFAAPFASAEIGRAKVLLHDIGKASNAYRNYIARPGSATKEPDHLTAGARAAVARSGAQRNRIMAFAIAGHHPGLRTGWRPRRGDR
jgi:CRISPR-associated endonuclease/helicase Cas3